MNKRNSCMQKNKYINLWMGSKLSLKQSQLELQKIHTQSKEFMDLQMIKQGRGMRSLLRMMMQILIFGLEIS